MNTKSSTLKKALYIIIPLIIILIIVIKLKSNKETAQNKVYKYNKDEVLNVQADTLKIEDVMNENSYSGTFEPNRESKISSEIQGKINEILIDVGYSVNIGQSLVQLDNSLLELQLQTIDVQIEGLEADVNRYSILSKADAIQGVQLEKALINLKTSRIQRATILEQINKTNIRAPFKGIVTAKLTETGSFAAPGMPLLQLTDIANLKFTINIPEKDIRLFNLNQNYLITADAYPSVSLTGKAIMIGSKANMGSSFPVQFLVKNTSDWMIKSGMFGKLNMNNNIEKGILISSSSIVGSELQPQVYLINNGKANLKNIKISKKIQDKSMVSGGLKAGDVIVKSGFINLFDGANVAVK